MRKPFALIVFALVGASAIPSAHAASVWVTHATQKVRPTDAAGNATSAHLSAARNEFEAFQVVVRDGASGVQAVASDLTGSAGTIPSSNISIYREALYAATNASGPDGATGAWPDALVPDVDTYAHEKRNAFPFDVPAGEQRAIWVEILVPAGTNPGDYAGTVSVLGTGLPNGEVDVPVTLTVHQFTLPSTPSLHTAFGLSWNAPCVAHYGSYEACGGDPGVEAMRTLYARAALDHRISIEGLVYAGPSNDDWTHFDSVYGPYLDGTASTRLAGAKQTTLRYQASRTATLASSWAQHFRTKGWFDRLFDYTCDEPPATCAWSDITARAAIMHAADPAFRTLVTTTDALAATHSVLSSVNILAPVVNDVEPKAAADTMTSYADFQTGGGEVWWYQSCMSHGCGGTFGAAAGSAGTTDPTWAGWPSYAIDASAIRARAQEWLSFKNGISTELYYETGLHLDTAWTSSYDFGGNGDGTLFYPGKPDVIGGSTHIPVESIRLKLIREGIEDFEYLKILSDLGEGDWVRQQVQALFPAAGSASSVNADELYALRETIAQHIDAHLAPAGTGSSSSSSASSSAGSTASSSSASSSSSAGSTASSSSASSSAGSTGGSTGTSTGGSTSGESGLHTGSPGAATGFPQFGTSTTGTAGSTGTSPFGAGSTTGGSATQPAAVLKTVHGGCGSTGVGGLLPLLVGGAMALMRRRSR